MAVVITIANEKGGVGKTTSAVNLAAGLTLRLAGEGGANGRVLLIDLDPQGHALMSAGYGDHEAPFSQSLAALLVESPPPSVPPMLRRAVHHPNLYYIPGNRPSMVEAARVLPTLMANESRLRGALAPMMAFFSYIIIDTPPATGDLLVNGLAAASHIIIPVEASYLGVSGLRELQRTIEEVKRHFSPELSVLGYLPTLCDEQRSETQEILSEMQRRYPGKVFAPIHKSADLAYAHSAHMDVFTYRPPRQRVTGQLSSSSRPTQEYGQLVEDVLKLTHFQFSEDSQSD
ncbi:MAG: ParA family protein [Anaerolineaceae bacterium]